MRKILVSVFFSLLFLLYFFGKAENNQTIYRKNLFVGKDTTGKDSMIFSEFKELPLKAKRKIPLKTNEGTWTSLDVSPDGKTILFDMMGDLYKIPITGGQAE